MWDVKFRSQIVFLFHHRSFTLTMWDVKGDIKVDDLEQVYRFTLTMWDVKIQEQKVEQKQETVLP